MEPKQVDFCVIKQKIIKTDEVLQMYLENNNKLKKTIQVIKELKCKYDRSQLENERCTFSLKSLKTKHLQLETQCEELIKHQTSLEQKYSQTLIESHSHIQTLENELQMLKELNKASESLCTKKSSTTELAAKKCEELEQQLAAYKETENELKKEYNHLTKENVNLKSQLDKKNEEKMRAVNVVEKEKVKALQDLHCELDNKIKSHDQLCRQKDKEIHDLKSSLSDADSLKKRVTFLETENEKLKKDNLIKEQALIAAKNKKNARKSKSAQTDASFFQKEPDDDLDEMLRYYYTPILLSPCRSPVNMKNSDVPDIIVTPSTPVEEIVDTFPKNSNNPVDVTNDETTNVSCGNEIKNVPIKPIRNLKRRMILTNRNILKKRPQLKKKLKTKTQDSILRALQLLNKSKINFTISNESPFPKQINLIPHVEGLACNSHNCNETYMLVNKSNEGLLGFFDKKTVTRLDFKERGPLTWLQNKLKQEITPDNVLDKLAELVFEKMKKRPNSFRTDSSGYISETEGESEHLFEKPSNDILAVNALLMKKLKEGCLIREQKTRMGSEVSSEISLPSYLNDQSRTSSVAECTKLYHRENDVLSRAESNSECNEITGVDNTSVKDVDCTVQEVENDCRAINDTAPIEDVSVIDWSQKDVSINRPFPSISPICNFSTNNPIRSALDADTRLTVKRENVEFPDDINERKIKILNVEIYKNFVKQIGAKDVSVDADCKVTEETVKETVTERVEGIESEGKGDEIANDASRCTNPAVNSPFGSIKIVSPATSFLTPSPKSVGDNSNPSLLSPLSDSSTASNNKTNKFNDVKCLINNKFQSWTDKLDNESNETWVKPITDSPSYTRSNTNKNNIEEDSATAPTFSNADNCINSLLRDENVMTEEIDSFLNIFQSNKSFSELNRSFANSAFDSKLRRQLLFTKSEKSSINVSDILNKTTVAKIEDVTAECPLSPEPVSKEAWDDECVPKIIPLERVEEADSYRGLDVLKETQCIESLPITKKKVGRPRKVSSSLEASTPSPSKRTRTTRVCKSNAYDSDEWVSEFKNVSERVGKETGRKIEGSDSRVPEDSKIANNKNQKRTDDTSDDTSDSGVLDGEFVPRKTRKRITKRQRKTYPNDTTEVLKAKDILSPDDEEKSCCGKNQMECNPNQAVPVKRGRGRPRKYPKEDEIRPEEADQLTDEQSTEQDLKNVPLSPDDVPSKPRKSIKKITKLQSKIMKQMKEKRKMLRKQPVDDSGVGCDVRFKENSIDTESLSRITNDTNLSSKDFMHRNQGVNVKGNDHSNLKNVICRNRKAIKNKSDILSLIIKDMDRIKPQAKRTVIKREVPEGIGEKQWRRNVLEIAEIVHDKRNVDMKDIYGPQPYQRHRNGILVNGTKVPAKITVLLKKVLAIPNEDDIPESIMLEFKRLPINEIVDIVLYQVSKDINAKPDRKYDPAPLMTRTQRIFLCLLVRLEKEKGFENALEHFFFRTQEYIFKRGCSVQAAIPLTRLFLSLCRLHANINRMRTFCCEAFFHAGDLAIPIFFTVLTSWIDVMPLEVDVKTYPLAKVLFQLVHLKTCKKPGYNLFPLKCLLSQYHGYRTERWECDTIFDELGQEYLRNPCMASDYAIRLFCKNKDTKFVYKKLNEFFKPLIYKIPSENVNFKSATIILMGKICRQFKIKNEHDQKCLVELKRWFEGLLEDNPADLIKQSINISIEHLPSGRKRPKNHYFDVKTSNADDCANERTF